VWRLGRASVEQVVQELPEGQTWASPTVRTYLDRSVAKGYLAIEYEGSRVFFKPKVDYEEALRERTADFLEEVCQGEAASLEVVGDVVAKSLKQAKRAGRGRTKGKKVRV